MVSWSANGLLSERESLNWIHRTHVKKRDVVAYAISGLGAGVDGAGQMPGTHWPVSPQGSVRSVRALPKRETKAKRGRWLLSQTTDELQTSERDRERKCQNLREGFSPDESPGPALAWLCRRQATW